MNANSKLIEISVRNSNENFEIAVTLGPGTQRQKRYVFNNWMVALANLVVYTDRDWGMTISDICQVANDNQEMAIKQTNLCTILNQAIMGIPPDPVGRKYRQALVGFVKRCRLKRVKLTGHIGRPSWQYYFTNPKTARKECVKAFPAMKHLIQFVEDCV